MMTIMMKEKRNQWIKKQNGEIGAAYTMCISFDQL